LTDFGVENGKDDLLRKSLDFLADVKSLFCSDPATKTEVSE
jgi:hypothetical protein